MDKNPPRKKIVKLLKEIKYSYHNNSKIYTEGSCFRLYKILQTIYPKAKPYYSNIDGHMENFKFSFG
jgi:hypothetical protein